MGPTHAAIALPDLFWRPDCAGRHSVLSAVTRKPGRLPVANQPADGLSRWPGGQWPLVCTVPDVPVPRLSGVVVLCPGFATAVCAIGTAVCLWAISYFGSKAAMVGVIMAGGIYFNYYVRTFTWGEIAVAAGLGVPTVLISPWLQGNFDSLKETLQYYDYFDNAVRYVGRSENFGPNFGGTLLSSLWEYVPRRVWPAKPFVYGSVVVNEHFFPGAAEVGYTPGYLPWIPYHLDFGVTGVAVGASAFGFLIRRFTPTFSDIAASWASCAICRSPLSRC